MKKLFIVKIYTSDAEVYTYSVTATNMMTAENLAIRWHMGDGLDIVRMETVES